MIEQLREINVTLCNIGIVQTFMAAAIVVFVVWYAASKHHGK